MDVNSYLGTKFTLDQVKELLKSLTFKVRVEGNNLSVECPTYRNDIKREVDIYEEIARLFGYSNIKSSLLDKRVSLNKSDFSIIKLDFNC